MFSVRLLSKAHKLTLVPHFFSRQRKICKTAEEAIEGLNDGSSVMFGGFGLGGIPENLIQAIQKKGTKNITAISNNCGITDWGLGLLLQTKQISKMIASYVGENAEFERQYLSGELEVELTPQGTLAEKIRAGGAGIPGFYTGTGVGTWVEEGGMPLIFQKGGKEIAKKSLPKKRKNINGRDLILEESLFADFAIVKAWKADTLGNLVYRKSARNFNQDMATAAKMVVAEVEEIVEAGQIDPDFVHTSSVYVNRIYKGEKFQKKFEKITLDQSDQKESGSKKTKAGGVDVREKIVKRAVKEISSGMHVNLGIGIPTLVPAFLSKDVKITLHSENGILGVGNYPKKGHEDPDLINAGKETVTINPGASFFSSSTSFAMVRGGHLDLTILGAMQVSKGGDIANWIIPGKMVKGMGGAMDLVACGSKVVAVMEHTARGAHKILEKCNLPLTGRGVVDKVITEKAVFERREGELVLTEVASESSLEEVRQLTGFAFRSADDLKKF